MICADVAGTGCGSAWKSWCSITAATVAASAAIAAIVATNLDPGPSPSGSLGALWCHGLAQTWAPCGQITCLVCMLPTRLSALSLCLHLVYLLCSRACSMVPLDLTYNTSLRLKLWISRQWEQNIEPNAGPLNDCTNYMFCCQLYLFVWNSCYHHVILGPSVLKSLNLNLKALRMPRPQSWKIDCSIQISLYKHLNSIFHCLPGHHFTLLSVVHLGMVCRHWIHKHHQSCEIHVCWFLNGDTFRDL